MHDIFLFILFTIWYDFIQLQKLMWGLKYTRHRNKKIKLNPFNTGRHFYLDICARLEHFIDITKGAEKSED
ncbi:hypothetical protein E2C01_018891 [Portunus trituberculatus]|uniref:Uncharacterized protein n=1 Tax=Portunus trituberculatus TaxID=210409 RepID=A0A5B7DXL0_PORTR|nr:hypothetical protein [Portunus trituberculatus]